jgi:O-antigen biosynthesis protein
VQISLEPFEHCELQTNQFVATGPDPWLRVVGALPRRGTWFRITYSSSYLDHLVRPLIRFEGTDEWEVMRAPYFGRAEWVGFYPKNATGLLVSPTNQAGPFRFRIDALERVFLPTLYLRALQNDSKSTFMSIGARVIGARKEMRQALMFARGGVPLEQYDKWRRRQTRALERMGIDAPYREENLHVRYVTINLDDKLIQNTALWQSLNAQSYQDWSLAVITPAADTLSVYNPKSGGKEQIFQPSTSITCGLNSDDLVTYAALTSIVPEYTLATMIESAYRHQNINIFYGDSDVIHNGRHCFPRLQTDCSPRLKSVHEYIKNAIFCRASAVAVNDGPIDAISRLTECMTEPLVTKGMLHIRRIVSTLVLDQHSDASPNNINEQSYATHILRRHGDTVSIIIPSKDNIHILDKCLSSISEFTSPFPEEIIIVDNGSREETWEYYNSLKYEGLKIISSPGDFNFSKMCNLGASIARSKFVVFMNNDVEAIEAGWIDPMIDIACQNNVGIVGPVLLFPDRTIQHAGVVVGMGGYADHVYQGLPHGDRGYLDRLQTSHEVAAVTGAVMVTKRDRFIAIGGFDAKNFPVELNDIDLCLRFNAEGLHTVLCTRAQLIHHQSKTRGFQFKPFTRYAQERNAFKKLHSKVIRDDPYYNPALSLFSLEISLDG